MTIPVKIECGCGQHYAFDVEPVDGRMPSTVACPACGSDGTVAANAFLAQQMTPRPAAANALANGLRLRSTAAAPPVHPEPPGAPAPLSPPVGGSLMGGQVDHTQAEHEARAKILWGDHPDEVVKLLVLKGLPAEEATGIVRALEKERAAVVRGNGIKHLLAGSGLVAVPIVAYFIFLRLGVLPIKLFAITVAVGLWGGWKLFNGTFMLLAPKWQSGDVAEQ